MLSSHRMLFFHTEPTHEARAETKLALAMPCKKEEDRRSMLWSFHGYKTITKPSNLHIENN